METLPVPEKRRTRAAKAPACRRRTPRVPGLARAHNPKSNRLLAALSEAELQRWLPQLELVALPLGQVLYESGIAASHAYFPTTAVASLLYEMDDGLGAEIAVVGSEDMVGIPLLMGGHSTPSRSVVQNAGKAFRLKASAITEKFNRGGPTSALLLRYMQALMAQIAQTAVCNRHHNLGEQLCRWLLTGLDRVPGNEIVVTQELIAALLGVRRESVTLEARNLQADGLIRYVRGRIRVLDRKGLEARSCECYAVVRDEFDRLLPPKPAL
jgi:CRP-like cAMP-binding protein